MASEEQRDDRNRPNAVNTYQSIQERAHREKESEMELAQQLLQFRRPLDRQIKIEEAKTRSPQYNPKKKKKKKKKKKNQNGASKPTPKTIKYRFSCDQIGFFPIQP